MFEALNFIAGLIQSMACILVTVFVLEWGLGEYTKIEIKQLDDSIGI